MPPKMCIRDRCNADTHQDAQVQRDTGDDVEQDADIDGRQVEEEAFDALPRCSLFHPLFAFDRPQEAVIPTYKVEDHKEEVEANQLIEPDLRVHGDGQQYRGGEGHTHHGHMAEYQVDGRFPGLADADLIAYAVHKRCGEDGAPWHDQQADDGGDEHDHHFCVGDNILHAVHNLGQDAIPATQPPQDADGEHNQKGGDILFAGEGGFDHVEHGERGDARHHAQRR